MLEHRFHGLKRPTENTLNLGMLLRNSVAGNRAVVFLRLLGSEDCKFTAKGLAAICVGIQGKRHIFACCTCMKRAPWIPNELINTTCLPPKLIFHRTFDALKKSDLERKTDLDFPENFMIQRKRGV